MENNMSNEQILINAIQKSKIDAEIGGTGNVKVFNGDEIPKKIISPIEFIFSHDFAKAFWGEEHVCFKCGLEESKFDGVDCTCSEIRLIDSWKFHLMIIILKKEPIKYLEKFL